LIVEHADGTLASDTPYRYRDTPDVGDGRHAGMTLTVTVELPHANLADAASSASHPAVAAGTRRVRSGIARIDVPVYLLADQQPGSTAHGPAIVEGPFFTARVLDGWNLQITAGGDILLTDTL